ncbi:MAG: RnfABCDGE type electron transport complex subunit D [Clostridia bacterium]|nr:RnfABCDGE type electron transport complex subunit D [Clostridia bacterium]
MSSLTKVMVSPHIHSGKSTSGIMGDVLISLLPTTVAGTLIFGWRALLVVAVSVLSSVGFEALFNYIIKKEQTISDLSAAVTGLLLALNLSVDIPLWQCVIGSLFAIVVVKCLFGGIGKNLVNPAITARVFMVIAFSSVALPSFPIDSVATATPLSAETMPSLLDLFIGNRGGAIGETCTVALLIGGIYLIIRRVISWHIPVTFIGIVFIFSFFMEGFNATEAISLIMSGGLFIGAFFMATDYTTSPSTPWGKVIFGLGAGLLTCLIRYFGIYPEGVSFAILFMNILTPYINGWTRRKVFTAGGNK